jgi:hypothetical protein
MIHVPPEEPHLRRLVSHARFLWMQQHENEALRFYNYAYAINQYLFASKEYRASLYAFPLMEMLIMLGKDDEAYQYLQESDYDNLRNKFAQDMADTYQWLGRHDEAATIIRQEGVTERPPSHWEVYETQERSILAFAVAGEWDLAQNAITTLRSLPYPGDYHHHPAAILAQVGTIAWGKGQYELGKILWQDALDEANAIEPRLRSEVLACVAEEWSLGDRTTAQTLFKEAVVCINHVRPQDQEVVADYVYARLIGAGFDEEANRLGKLLTNLYHAQALATAHQLRRLTPLASVSQEHAQKLRHLILSINSDNSMYHYANIFARAVYVLARYGNYSLSEMASDHLFFATHQHRDATSTYAKGLFDRGHFDRVHSLVFILKQQERWQAHVAEALVEDISFEHREQAIHIIRKMTPQIYIAYDLMRMESWEDAHTMLSQVRIDDNQWGYTRLELDVAHHILSIMRQVSSQSPSSPTA